MKVEKPHRVSRSYTQTIDRPPAEVFPLLCPVREVEWVNGWKPRLVLTESGFAEPDCAFITPGQPEDALWVITAHDPDRFLLEILKLIPTVVVGKISIQLRAADNDATEADITYAYTALGEYGRRVLADFSEEHFQAFMKAWQDELNHFLRTGQPLPMGGDT